VILADHRNGTPRGHFLETSSGCSWRRGRRRGLSASRRPVRRRDRAAQLDSTTRQAVTSGTGARAVRCSPRLLWPAAASQRNPDTLAGNRNKPERRPWSCCLPHPLLSGSSLAPSSCTAGFADGQRTEPRTSTRVCSRRNWLPPRDTYLLLASSPLYLIIATMLAALSQTAMRINAGRGKAPSTIPEGTSYTAPTCCLAGTVTMAPGFDLGSPVQRRATTSVLSALKRSATMLSNHGS